MDNSPKYKIILTGNAPVTNDNAIMSRFYPIPFISTWVNPAYADTDTDDDDDNDEQKSININN